MPPPAGRHRRTRPPPSPRSAPQASRPAITLLVYLPRSCSQPFGFQRVPDPRLMAPVHDHGNSERPQFSVGLRYVHPLDRAGLPGRDRGCTRTASSALAWEVSATSPSIPAVLRPALRCVTCRTLTSVFDRLRSIIFCRFLTLGQSPSRVALKIRCRSRRTSFADRQSTQSQSIGVEPGSGGGPPVRSPRHGVLTCPSVPVVSAASSSKAHLPHVSPLSQPGAPGPVSGQLYAATGGGADRPRPRFPVAFRPPAFASWASCSRQRNSAPLTVGLPRHHTA